MGELVDQLGNKLPGQLIKSDDWNALVAAVENVEASLSQRIDDLSASVDTRFATLTNQVTALSTQLSDLAAQFGTFRASVEALLGQYYRVTLEATKATYALGELAEITARVTDLAGNPLDLANVADRPWIDFVTVWGQLRAVPGSTSMGGVGNRTIAVQVNAEGIARVRLQAEHAEGLTEEAEAEVAASLSARPTGSQMTIAEAILEAATPLDGAVKPAFRTLSVEYDRSDALSVRNYVDTYYLRYAPQVADARFTPAFRHRWRDYQTTVMAFARRDSDPRTPDQGRGASSIQVTFRDWIGPWIILDYLVEIEDLVADFRGRLAPKVTTKFDESFLNFKAEIAELTQGRGLVGKQRDYVVARNALDGLTVSQPPAFFNSLTKSVQGALSIQQALHTAQVAALGMPSQDVAFDVFADTATKADVSVAGIGEQIATLEGQLAEFQQGFASIGSQVASLQTGFRLLDERTTNIQVEGSNLRTDINVVRDQVRSFEQLNLTDIHDSIGKVGVLWADRLNIG